MGQSAVEFGAASADYEARSAQWKQNITNTYAAAESEHGQLLQRQLQEQDALSIKQRLSLIEEAEAKAAAQVSAAGAGVSGTSVENILGDIGRKAATNRAIDQQNYRMTAAQLQQEHEAVSVRAQNRFASVSMPTGPSPFGLALEVAGAGITAYGKM